MVERTRGRENGRRIAICALLAAALLTGLLLGPGGATGSDSARVAVPGSVPSWATAAREIRPASGRVDFAMVLRWRHRRALDAFGRAVSDPSSSSYGHYLTPAQFRARYSPRPAAVHRVSRWLAGHGFDVTGVSKSRMLVNATGSVGQAERAFAAPIRVYRLHGREAPAPAQPLSVPADLPVISVAGLSGSISHPLRVPPPPVFRNARPCSNFFGQSYPKTKVAPKAFGQRRPYAVCGYIPKQFQGAYGTRKAIHHGLNGRGQKVAILDAFASPTIRRDTNIYSRRHGLPRVRLRQRVIHGRCPPRVCTGALRQGWWGEETLDVEAVHSMAPKAKILYVAAPNPGLGLLKAFTWVVDHRAARIITNSYGSLGEQGPKFQANEQAFSEAIAEGIGVYFSAGDNGDENDVIGFVSADYPGSSPRVTAVGGTTLGVGPIRNRSFELGWATFESTKVNGRWSPKPPGDFLYAGGGGTSLLFAEPSYQRGVVPHGLAARYGGHNRVIPDISMDGDPTTGMLVGETEQFPNGKIAYVESRAGGTSLSSPLFAGFMALADQRAGFHHGFVNPALYSLYRTNAIRDIRPSRVKFAMVRRDYTNGVNTRDGITVTLRTAVRRVGTLRTRRGYDNLTGLGSPNGSLLLRALAHR